MDKIDLQFMLCYFLFAVNLVANIIVIRMHTAAPRPKIHVNPNATHLHPTFPDFLISKPANTHKA